MNHAVTTPLDIKLMNMTAMVLFVGFVALGALVTARWMVRLPVFDIKGIAVTGEVNHNNALTLRANVAPRLAGTFYSMDLATVRSAFEAVPWVRRAVVRREFPNRLHVVLQEHQAVAYWGDDSELRLINSYGEVFEANVGEVEQDTLPHLSGPEGHGAEVLAMYRTLAPLFTPLGGISNSGAKAGNRLKSVEFRPSLTRGRAGSGMSRFTRILRAITWSI